MALVPRLATERLAEQASSFRVVIVNGPRQAGKTTLLRLFQDEHDGAFRSLDDATVLQAAREDPTGFAAYGPTPRIIDEVQRGGDSLILAIKHVVDRDNNRGQYVLAGSTQFLTVPTLSESLAGRAVFLDLWPLAAAEIFGAAGDFCDRAFAGPTAFTLDPSSGWDRLRYLDTICVGGYPEVVELGSPRHRQSWFDGYISTVILRDIGSFAQVQQADLVPRLLAMIAARAGTPTVLSDLAQGLQVSHATARSYTSYLDTVFLTYSVPPWSPNLTARAIKTHKVFPTDSGLAAHLLNVDRDALARPGNKTTGTLVETFAFAELTRLLAAGEHPAKLYFYRDRDNREVDFILEDHGGHVVGIEVKAASSAASDDFRHLRWLSDQLGERFRGGYVLYLGTETLPFGDRMLALPLSALWHHAAAP